MDEIVLKKHLKQLFIIDGLGALLSAFLLGVVLVHFETHFKIPIPTLYLLATLPILFALYDCFCYFLVDHRLAFYLRIIAIVNLLYCCLSIGLAFYHIQEITLLAWAYIIIEIIIVVTIALYELRISNTFN